MICRDFRCGTRAFMNAVSSFFEYTESGKLFLLVRNAVKSSVCVFLDVKTRAFHPTDSTLFRVELDRIDKLIRRYVKTIVLKETER